MCSHCGLTVCLLWPDNQIQDGGATKLAEELATNSTVTSIDLECEKWDGCWLCMGVCSEREQLVREGAGEEREA